MERRQMLKSLFAGGLMAGLSAPVLAQQGAPRPKPPRTARGDDAQQSGDQMVMAIPQELEDVLREWEQKTARISRLHGSHQRFEYDEVFGIDRRVVGKFWYESPDKGRIDFKEAPTTDPETGEPLVSRKKSATGEPFQVETDEPMTWLCDGKSIMQIEHEPKTYALAEIPPQHQGENIMDSPLPFLFGMKADKLKQRYKLSLGSQHNKPGSDGRKQYHIVALPLLQSDARNWQRAEVMLDAQYCLPRAIRLIDPAGSKETVYVFPLRHMKAESSKSSSILNKLWPKSDPFKMQLFGYKLTEKQVAPPPGEAPEAVVPASGSEPAGRARLDFNNDRDD